MSRCTQDALCCGPFMAGEIPDALSYRFLRADGSPVDLQGFQARFCWAERWGPGGSGNAQTTDAVNGEVTYTWGAADIAAPGRYTGHFWVEKGNQTRYASLPIRFDVLAAACQELVA